MDLGGVRAWRFWGPSGVLGIYRFTTAIRVLPASISIIRAVSALYKASPSNASVLAVSSRFGHVTTIIFSPLAKYSIRNATSCPQVSCVGTLTVGHASLKPQAEFKLHECPLLIARFGVHPRARVQPECRLARRQRLAMGSSIHSAGRNTSPHWEYLRRQLCLGDCWRSGFEIASARRGSELTLLQNKNRGFGDDVVRSQPWATNNIISQL